MLCKPNLISVTSIYREPHSGQASARQSWKAVLKAFSHHAQLGHGHLEELGAISFTFLSHIFFYLPLCLTFLGTFQILLVWIPEISEVQSCS